MAIDRRVFLALGASALLLFQCLFAEPVGQALYVAARRRGARHEAVVLDEAGA